MSEAVFLDELAAGLARRSTPLSPESAIFIVLEAMEALGSRAMILAPSSVLVGTDGVVSIGGSLDFAHDETSVLEGAIETLEAVLDPAPTAVTELAVKVRTGQVIARGAMLSELVAMLVPLNRGAARRMTGRLAREYTRPATPSAMASVRPGSADVSRPGEDRALVDALARLAEAEGGGGAADTVLDAPSMSRDGSTDDPDDLWSQRRAERRSARERRNAWLTLAVAVCALAAAVVFLVQRVKGAGA